MYDSLSKTKEFLVNVTDGNSVLKQISTYPPPLGFVAFQDSANFLKVNSLPIVFYFFIFYFFKIIIIIIVIVIIIG